MEDAAFILVGGSWRASDEAELIYKRLNEERKERRADKIVFHEEAAAVSESHAEDMIENEFFLQPLFNTTGSPSYRL